MLITHLSFSSNKKMMFISSIKCSQAPFSLGLQIHIQS